MDTNLSSLADGIKCVDRGVLFLCDTWNELSEGIAGVNRSLAISLTGYKGVQVIIIMSTMFQIIYMEILTK